MAASYIAIEITPEHSVQAIIDSKLYFPNKPLAIFMTIKLSDNINKVAPRLHKLVQSYYIMLALIMCLTCIIIINTVSKDKAIKRCGWKNISTGIIKIELILDS